MTLGEKLFFFIIYINLLAANVISVEFSVVPKINCNDLNNNQFSDFIAFSDFDVPRTIYHLDLVGDKVEILWKYEMSNEINGYFVDLILNDFDGDGNVELIAVSYQENNDKIMYIFSSKKGVSFDELPLIVPIENSKSEINNPTGLYSFSPNSANNLFVLTQGSPNRQIIMCEYINNKIIARGYIATTFLDETISPINIALGDFNNNRDEDIFVLSNGIQPSGYFVYSDGKEEKLDLFKMPKIKILNPKGVDLNFDEQDELVFITNDSQLMSSIWNNNGIALSDSKIQNIMINSNSGLLYLNVINNKGEIINHVIDPVTQKILSSEFIEPAFINDYDEVYSILFEEQIVLSHNGNKSELWIYNMPNKFVSELEINDMSQKIYYRQPDFIVDIGETFYHKIEWKKNSDFRNFIEEELPKGMEFNLENIQLEWTPNKQQLGFHQFAYNVDLRQKGNLEIDILNGKKIISQEENEIQNNFSYLIYVNDLIDLKANSDSLIIVNNQLFEWEIPIDDKNADSQLEVKILGQDHNANFKMIFSEPIMISDTIIDSQDNLFDLIILDSNVVDISQTDFDKSIEVLDTVEIYIDTVKTEFEEFTETKKKLEDDPLKKKKLEESDEDFKLNEEEYREKLKTHKKILRDGKNIWVPIDSLNAITTKTNIIDSTSLLDQPIIIASDTSNIKTDSLLDVSSNNDTSYVEISYREILNYKSLFSWTPNVSPGDYEFVLFASDGFSTDTNSVIITVHPEINLNNMNEDSLIATVDKVFSFKIILQQEPKSDRFYYDLINAPENMKIDSLGKINWVPLPTQVDDYNFKIKVTDGIATQILPMYIYVNAPPVISYRPSKNYFLSIGEELNFPLESFDLNQNAFLQWKLVSGPTAMNLSSSGILEWANPKLGHHMYEIQLNDGMDTVKWEASIYVNAKPEFTSKPLTVVETGKKYIYNLTAWDANKMNPYDSLSGNNIIFSLPQGPEGLNIDENNILNWNTEDVPLGEYMVTVAVSDGVNEEKQTFPIFVNSLPNITSSDSIILQVGENLNFQIEAIDNNIEDTLTFHLDPLPGNMIMELNSGLLKWTPQNEDIGINVFRLQVKDGHDLEGTFMQFKIFVYELPQLTSNLSNEAFTDLEYTEFLTGIDMNGNKLDFPESITINSATFDYYNLSQYTHLFKWTPRDVDKGNHEIIIKLTDEYGFSNLYKHKITVFSNPCIKCGNNEDLPPDSTK